MKNILVTGGNGQLGSCIKWVTKSRKNEEYNYTFVDVNDLDITNSEAVDSFFSNNSFDYIINCAAFTDVNNSQNNITAFNVNVMGPMILTNCANKYGMKIIHISTDYVFDGNRNTPYTEDDEAKAINSYGITKLMGEKYVSMYPQSYIIRTSWLYSIYGKNFFLSMLNRIKSGKETEVVIDQVGTPTSARSLAKFLVWLVENGESKNVPYGIYHFSNEGVCSWYDFAVAIEDKTKRENFSFNLEKNGVIKPITTKAYEEKNNLKNEPRPTYSVLSKEKIKQYYPEINHWLIDLSNEAFYLGLNGYWDR